MIAPATEPPRIFCIRHGETVWSLLRKHTGPASLGVLSYDPDHPEVPVLARWNLAATPDEFRAS